MPLQEVDFLENERIVLNIPEKLCVVCDSLTEKSKFENAFDISPNL